MRNEVSYYAEIQAFIEAQLKSNFMAGTKKTLNVFWGIGELKSNLHQILQEYPSECSCALEFARRVPPLNLDIFALITNGKKYELLILEIKLVKSAGLKEWSQLVGYCLVSGASYGLLINIDNGGSTRLSQLLQTEHHITHIQTVVGGKACEHCLGFMQWNSLTKNFEYSNLGSVKSLSKLCELLIAKFTDE